MINTLDRITGSVAFVLPESICGVAAQNYPGHYPMSSGPTCRYLFIGPEGRLYAYIHIEVQTSLYSHIGAYRFNGSAEGGDDECLLRSRVYNQAELDRTVVAAVDAIREQIRREMDEHQQRMGSYLLQLKDPDTTPTLWDRLEEQGRPEPTKGEP